MKRLCLILAATLAALAVPAFAHGGVALRVERVRLGAVSHGRFDMLALHWSGRGRVVYRTHRVHGAWSRWRDADHELVASAWTGPSDALQVRRVGVVGRVRAFEIRSPVTTPPARGLAEAGLPSIVPRAGWGANEEIVRAKPVFAPAVRLAIIHHTAGTNTYTRAQAAAIVRGIEEYHVKGNGWNDIGYNFLVDRFGTVYEGRAGGIDRNVVGAHSEGFNTGTVGIALIGNFQNATPPKAMQEALVNLLAWRLDVAHVDPLATVVYTSGGNTKFPAGKVVTLRAISGHRDTGPSECPGNDAYALLPGIAARVAAAGLPKLYSPTVAGTLGSAVRFQARLSSSLPWTVTVADSLGRVVASGSGRGAAVDWTWSSLVAGKGLYTWTIAAPGVRVATGTLGVGRPVPPPAALSLTALVASPAVVAPNADGTFAPATLSFTLGAPATVKARVVDATGATLVTVFDGRRPAGANAVQWDPGRILGDGRYQVVVTATSGTKSVTRWADVVVDRTVAGLSVSPATFSPNHDLMLDSTTFAFLLAAPAQARLQIVSAGVVVADVFAGPLAAGANTIAWDGSGYGPPLFDGTYTAVLTVTDALGDVPFSVPVRIDTTPPHLQLVDRASLTFSLDEPASVTVVVNGRTSTTQDEPAGTFTIPFAGAVTSVSAQAVDAAGNVSKTVSG